MDHSPCYCIFCFKDHLTLIFLINALWMARCEFIECCLTIWNCVPKLKYCLHITDIQIAYATLFIEQVVLPVIRVMPMNWQLCELSTIPLL